MKSPWSESRMREIRTSGLMSGEWKRSGSLAVTAPLLDSTAVPESVINTIASPWMPTAWGEWKRTITSGYSFSSKCACRTGCTIR